MCREVVLRGSAEPPIYLPVVERVEPVPLLVTVVVALFDEYDDDDECDDDNIFNKASVECGDKVN